MNLAQLFKDTSITITDNGGTIAPTIHLAGLEGCVHILVEDWEKLHSSVMALLDGVPAQLAAANDQAPTDTPPADQAPADQTDAK